MSDGIERIKSARKPWACMLCNGRIEVGQPYTRIRRRGRPVVVIHFPESACPPALSDPKEEQTNGDAQMPGSKVGESATLSSGRDERKCAGAEDENERPPHEIHAASVSRDQS